MVQVYGNFIESAGICDRLVNQLISKPKNFVFYGNYGMGKTEALKGIKVALKESRSKDVAFFPISVDLGYVKDLRDFLVKIAESLFLEIVEYINPDLRLKITEIDKAIKGRKNGFEFADKELSELLLVLLDLANSLRPQKTSFSIEYVIPSLRQAVLDVTKKVIPACMQHKENTKSGRYQAVFLMDNLHVVWNLKEIFNSPQVFSELFQVDQDKLWDDSFSFVGALNVPSFKWLLATSVVNRMGFENLAPESLLLDRSGVKEMAKRLLLETGAKGEKIDDTLGKDDLLDKLYNVCGGYPYLLKRILVNLKKKDLDNLSEIIDDFMEDTEQGKEILDSVMGMHGVVNKEIYYEILVQFVESHPFYEGLRPNDYLLVKLEQRLQEALQDQVELVGSSSQIKPLEDLAFCGFLRRFRVQQEYKYCYRLSSDYLANIISKNFEVPQPPQITQELSYFITEQEEKLFTQRNIGMVFDKMMSMTESFKIGWGEEPVLPNPYVFLTLTNEIIEYFRGLPSSPFQVYIIKGERGVGKKLCARVLHDLIRPKKPIRYFQYHKDNPELTPMSLSYERRADEGNPSIVLFPEETEQPFPPSRSLELDLLEAVNFGSSEKLKLKKSEDDQALLFIIVEDYPFILDKDKQPIKFINKDVLSQSALVHIPPLRQRPWDVIPIFSFWLKKYGLEKHRMTKDLIDSLLYTATWMGIIEGSQYHNVDLLKRIAQDITSSSVLSEKFMLSYGTLKYIYPAKTLNHLFGLRTPINDENLQIVLPIIMPLSKINKVKHITEALYKIVKEIKAKHQKKYPDQKIREDLVSGLIGYMTIYELDHQDEKEPEWVPLGYITSGFGLKRGSHGILLLGKEQIFQREKLITLKEVSKYSFYKLAKQIKDKCLAIVGDDLETFRLAVNRIMFTWAWEFRTRISESGRKKRVKKQDKE